MPAPMPMVASLVVTHRQALSGHGQPSQRSHAAAGESGFLNPKYRCPRHGPQRFPILTLFSLASARLFARVPLARFRSSPVHKGGTLSGKQ